MTARAAGPPRMRYRTAQRPPRRRNHGRRRVARGTSMAGGRVGVRPSGGLQAAEKVDVTTTGCRSPPSWCPTACGGSAFFSTLLASTSAIRRPGTHHPAREWTSLRAAVRGMLAQESARAQGPAQGYEHINQGRGGLVAVPGPDQPGRAGRGVRVLREPEQDQVIDEQGE